MFDPKRCGIPPTLVHKTLFRFSLLFLRKYKIKYVEQMIMPTVSFSPTAALLPHMPRRAWRIIFYYFAWEEIGACFLRCGSVVWKNDRISIVILGKLSFTF